MQRLFDADVNMNAPKNRTFLNYEVKNGWAKLRKFLEIENEEYEEFPHEHKTFGISHDYAYKLFAKNKFKQRYLEDLQDYFEHFGMSLDADDGFDF
jgi:hypothetical protein